MARACVLATGNAGKLREFRRMLADSGLDIQPQSAFAVPEAVEDGLSFVENALIKARNACRHTGLPALADDSGLVVPALQGRPGIHSSRFAGEQATDEDNLQKLLREMRDLQGEDRRAHFQCVIVFLGHAEDPVPLIASGQWHGRILLQPAGEQGFGYDPVFLPDGQTQSAAQLPPSEKDRLSHRGQALRALLAQLQHG